MDTSRRGSKGRYNIDYGIRDVYKSYKDEQKRRGITPVSRELFSKIIFTFNKELCRSVVEDSFEYRFPFRLGYLRIRKHKTKIKIGADGKLVTKHLKPDWVATKALWNSDEEAKKNKKLVYHSNSHSQRYYYRWYWDRSTCNIVNSSAYKLIMTRLNKRMIATTIKNNDNIDYYE